MESYITLDDIVGVKEIALDTVYDIEVEDNHNYYLDCGKQLLVHNSSKTWSIFYFWLLKALAGEKFLLTIARSKMTWVRDSLVPDFEEICERNGYPVSPNIDKKRNAQEYKIKNATFQFVGLDDTKKIHGQKRDHLWLNETMEITKKDFDQLEMRTSGLIILDYNPYDDSHWVFDLQKRKDVKKIHSTMLDNPYNPPAIINKIKGYEPTPENIEQGTADNYMWEVYGLGKKARLQGAIYTNWDVVEEIPTDCKLIGYGLDFGYTNDPTAIVALYTKDNELYWDELLYETGLLNEDIAEKMGYLMPVRDIYTYADSSEPKSIETIKRKGFNIKGATKGADSIKFGIDFLKGYKMHITKRSINLESELRKYKWAEDRSGKSLNVPIGKNDHGCDAMRYVATMCLQKRKARSFTRKAKVFV